MGGNYSSSRVLDILYLDLGLKQDKVNMTMEYIVDMSTRKVEQEQYKITNGNHVVQTLKYLETVERFLSGKKSTLKDRQVEEAMTFL